MTLLDLQDVRKSFGPVEALRGDTVTPVAAFSQDVAGPYMNIQLRQPIGFRRNSEAGGNGFEALVSVHNLLTQGYRPYVLSDGSVLIFAQGQRSVSGGLAFNF